MSTTTSIKITYALNPPAGTQSDELTRSKEHMFEIPVSPEGGQTAYYTALQTAIITAKDQIGNELTAWRDAVGKAELVKETKEILKSEGDDVDEEDDTMS